jgi:ssDNA-binding Zn-finger/Zn-ribbon topoisomerase 1
MTPKGFTCPTCKVHLHVRTSYKPSAGLIVRYRNCPKCGYRAPPTEERVVRHRRRKTA